MSSSRLPILLLLPALALAQPRQLPPRPRLLFNAAGIAHLQQRVQTTPWSAQWDRLRHGVDQALAQKIDLPPRGANWFHWYVCPRHGARLTTGKRIGPWEWEHICPVDREILHGNPSRPDRDFDGIILANTHARYADAIRDNGLLYQVTGDPRYAARARDILLAYGGRYLSYPLHNTHGEPKIGGGRVGPQTLDEAVWLIPVAQGADLVWDTLSEADRQSLAAKLFLPAARDVIMVHHMHVHNIQNWKNSAVGLTGFLLGDDALIHSAIDDPAEGYRTQMAKGVQEDGVWYEGAWGYHFYTLEALWPLLEAARNNGIDLYGEPLRKMFQAPIRLAMPNLLLPAFNDSVETDIHNPLYELAWARYHDAVMLSGIPAARANSAALWFGDDQVPPPPAAGPDAETRSRNFPASGYAILQQGEAGDATWLCLKYGPSGGGHGHPDKNNFILYAHGRVLFPDPGTRPYGSPLHAQWDKVTLAHNTLVADETSQTPATGRILAFGANYAMTDAGAIYPGVRFIRTAALLNQDLIVFVDQIQADRPHTFDLALHVNGKWRTPVSGAPPVLSSKDGYQHLRDAAARQTTDGVSLAVDAQIVRLAGSDPTEVITATGVGKSTEDRIPMAIFRRVAQKTTYVWAISTGPIDLDYQERAGVVSVTVNHSHLTVDPSRNSVTGDEIPRSQSPRNP
jgi:hypothetical protein